MNTQNTRNTGSGLVTRIRHDVKIRDLEVLRVDRLTPHYVRITFGGDDLADFVSLSPDDHVKIFVPLANGETAMRDYTPRSFDPAKRQLAIDFALHEAGPATLWALNARAGDRLKIGGPRGSAVISQTVQRWVLIGDETALPAIARRIEEAGPGERITCVVAVAGEAEVQNFDTQADLDVHWVFRPESAAALPAALLAKVKSLEVEAETFVWIAGEANVAKAVRAHFLDQVRHPISWMKAAGYWVAGQADTHMSLD
ncbi:siderophore-interacting protein [Oryzibacter oryziterrae]|uniref:siderophore-interacting protein n=1 Tax=Oryzibacter oryziterrae TaxID=2766474 RepID=UPI001F3A550D|nr:siderophore-interacting protein [Oryzibacter oryziterrae]